MSQNTIKAHFDLKMQVFSSLTQNKLSFICDMINNGEWEYWIETIKIPTQTESWDVTISNYMFLETVPFLL